jgi:cytochrome c oxidase assembly protein subunit 15
MVLLSIHLSNTLLLVAALALTALMLSTRQRWAELRGPRQMGLALTGLLATIIVGVTGSLAALGDTLFPSRSLAEAFTQDFKANSPGLLKLRVVHPISAFIAAAFVIYLVARSRSWERGRFGVRWLGSAVLCLLGIQFGLGVTDVLLLAPAWMQIVHLLGADLFWVTLVILAARIVWPETGDLRNLKPERNTV